MALCLMAPFQSPGERGRVGVVASVAINSPRLSCSDWRAEDHIANAPVSYPRLRRLARRAGRTLYAYKTIAEVPLKWHRHGGALRPDRPPPTGPAGGPGQSL